MEWFVGKLLEELAAAHTTEAIMIVNSATSTTWFQAAFRRANAVCFPDHKIRFIHATKNGMNPCAPQTIFYYGPDAARFCAAFAAVGVSTPISTAASPQLTLADAPPVPTESAPGQPDCPKCRKPTTWLVRKHGAVLVCFKCNAQLAQATA